MVVLVVDVALVVSIVVVETAEVVKVKHPKCYIIENYNRKKCISHNIKISLILRLVNKKL